MKVNSQPIPLPVLIPVPVPVSSVDLKYDSKTLLVDPLHRLYRQLQYIRRIYVIIEQFHLIRPKQS